jgi:hypothetical protein
MEMNPKTEAQKVYEQTRPTAAQIKFYGESSLTPIQKATLAQIEAHIQNCIDAADENHVNLDYHKIEFGKTRQEIFEIAASKTKTIKRGAGARALSARYGKQAAQDIIYRKTGRHYNLKG